MADPNSNPDPSSQPPAPPLPPNPIDAAGQPRYLTGGFLPPSPQTYAGPPDGYFGNAPYWRGPGGGIFPRTPAPAQQPDQAPDPSVTPMRPSGGWRPPYIPVAPRGIDQIGGDWWPIGAAMNYPGVDPGPSLPSAFEALGIIRGTGQQLGQWGSRSVGQYAGRASQLAMQLAPYLDAFTKGAFSRNYMAARMGMLRAMEEEMAINTEMALQQHKAELEKFGEIFENFRLGAYDTDKDHPGSGLKKAEAELKDLATLTHHDKLAAIIDNKGLAGAQAWLTWEDQKYRDMLAANTSRTKAKGDETSGGDYFNNPDTGFQGENPQPVQLNPLPGAGGALPQPQIAGAPKTASAAEAQAVLNNPKYNLNDAGKEAVLESLMGDNLPKGIPKLDAASRELKAAVNGITTGAGTPEEKLNEVGKVSRPLAERLKGLGEYDIDPKEYSIVGGGRGHMIDWVRQIYGNTYNTQNYDAIKQFKNTNSKEYQAVFRSNTAATGFSTVLKELNALGNDPKIPIQRMINEFAQKYWTGDSKYQGLYAALRQYSIESNAVGSGSGVPRVTLVENLLRHASPWASPAQIRDQLVVDLAGANSVVNGYTRDWRALKRDGSLPPGLNAPTLSLFDAYSRMNPYTGEMPRDAPVDAAVYSVKQRAPGGKKDEWTPHTRQEIDLIKKGIDDPLTTPEEKKRAIRELHGII